MALNLIQFVLFLWCYKNWLFLAKARFKGNLKDNGTTLSWNNIMKSLIIRIFSSFYIVIEQEMLSCPQYKYSLFLLHINLFSYVQMQYDKFRDLAQNYKCNKLLCPSKVENLSLCYSVLPFRRDLAPCVNLNTNSYNYDYQHKKQLMSTPHELCYIKTPH